MFDRLIKALEERKLISVENVRLLSQLRLDSYSDLADYMHIDTDRDIIIPICEMIRNSRFVSHTIEKDKVVDSLVLLLQSTDWEIRHVAVMAIGNLDAYEQLETLRKVITNDEHPGVKVTAIDVISHWRFPDVASILIPIATDSSFTVQVREAAIEGLGISDSIRALSTLTKLLDDPNDEIRYTSVIALGNTEVPNILKKLENLVDDSAPEKTGQRISAKAQEAIEYLKKR